MHLPHRCQKTGKNPNFGDCVRYMFVGRRLACLVTAALFGVAGVNSFAANTQARLVLAQETAKPGDTVLAGVHLHMNLGWHTYWRNSGQSGLPTSIDWQLPAGVSAGQIQWPIPKKLPEPEETTYIYEDNAVLLVPLKIDAGLKPGSLTLKARLDWLECETKCVKEGASVEASLTVGAASKPSKDADVLAKWQARLPRPAVALAPAVWWEGAAKGELRSVMVQWNA